MWGLRGGRRVDGVGRNPEELSRVSTLLTKLSGRGGGDYTTPSPQSHTRILLRHVPWEISPGLVEKKTQEGGSASEGEFLALQHKGGKCALSYPPNSTHWTSSILQHHGEQQHLVYHPWGVRFPRLNAGFPSSKGEISLRISPSM